MAFEQARLNQYKFFKNGGRVDQSFVENVLLPGITTQSSFSGGSSGIELPHGLNEPAEVIPLADAVELALDWFVYHKNLSSEKADGIRNLIGKVSYEQIGDALQVVLQKKVLDPQKLLRSRLTQNLAEFQHIKDSAALESTSRSNFHPATDLITFTKLQQEVMRLAAAGIPSNYIAQLIPTKLTQNVSALTQQRLIYIIANNPELLRIASLHPGNEMLASAAVVNKFAEIVKDQYPDFTGVLNFTGTDKFREGLYSVTSQISSQINTGGIPLSGTKNASLDDYLDLKIRTSNELPYLLPDQSTLLNQLTQVTIFTDNRDREIFARALLSTVVSSAETRLSGEEIITITGKRLGLTSAQIGNLTAKIQSSGLLPALEFEQNNVYLDLQTSRLTRQEKSLLKSGVNPFHVHYKSSELIEEAKTILAEPNLNVDDAEYKIRKLYNKQLNANNPDTIELSRLRFWLDNKSTLTFLDLPENSKLKRLVEQIQKNRRSTSLASKWLEFEDTITGGKLFRKYYEWYNKLAEKIILPIPLPGGKKLKVPLLNFWPWAFNQFDRLKRSSVLKIYKTINSQKWGFFDPARRLIKFSLREYTLGEFTTGGAVFHFGHKVWGNTLAWTISKTGLGGVFKYGVTNTARAATRLLIQVGGKTLAKSGVKIIAGLVAAGTVIGTVFSIVMAVSLIFDLLKLGFNLVKKFIRDADFRGKMIRLSAFVGAIFTTISLSQVGLALFILLGTLVQGIVLAGAIALGLVASVIIFFNVFKTTTNLDSGWQQFVAGIVCEEGGGGPGSAAVCIAETLIKCGLSPLKGSMVGSGDWKCLLASTAINDTARSQIEYSSHVDNTFQCVGMIAAYIAQAFGITIDQNNAKTYAVSPPQGFRFVSGAQYCRPGEVFVDTNGAVGHVGIVIDPDGDSITCVDANFSGPGVTRNQDTCRYLKSRIAGCLKKI